MLCRWKMVCWLTFGIYFLFMLLPLLAADNNSESSLPQGLNGTRASYEDILKSLRDSKFQKVESTKEPATLTLEELRRGQLAWREALKNMQVDFIYALDRVFKTSVDIQREREGRLVAPNFTFSMSIAFK